MSDVTAVISAAIIWIVSIILFFMFLQHRKIQRDIKRNRQEYAQVIKLTEDNGIYKITAIERIEIDAELLGAFNSENAMSTDELALIGQIALREIRKYREDNKG